MPPPAQTAMPYVTDGIMTLKYRFKRTCLGKNRHFLMRLNLFAKFFLSSLTCEVRQRPRVCYNGPNLSRLRSATFEQLLAFGATFCGFSNLEQVLPFRAIFEQNIGLEHISSTKKSTISWKTSIHANFLKAYHVINLLNT